MKNFSAGLAAVKISDKWGYINKNGDIIITPQYDVALNFFKGLAITIALDDSFNKGIVAPGVTITDVSGIWYYINTAGKPVWQSANKP
jgi:glucan-binding YG repeat protein